MNEPTEKSQKDPESYEVAFNELREILKSLQEGDVDIDKLTEKVNRGSELIKYCNSQIKNVEMQVNEVLSSIELGEDASE